MVLVIFPKEWYKTIIDEAGLTKLIIQNKHSAPPNRPYLNGFVWKPSATQQADFTIQLFR